MPSPEQFQRYQKAVLWPFLGSDEYGQPVVGSPQEIKVRWLNKRRNVLQSDGNVLSFDASAVVNLDIAVGSRLWLGSIDDLAGTGTVDEVTLENIMEVKTFDSTPDIKNRLTQRTVSLIKLREATVTDAT